MNTQFTGNRIECKSTGGRECKGDKNGIIKGLLLWLFFFCTLQEILHKKLNTFKMTGSYIHTIYIQYIHIVIFVQG